MDNQKDQGSNSFNFKKSDPKAVEIAATVIDSMGGWANWKNTRYLTWNFFNYRKWIWDKWTGDVRMEASKDSLTILMNLLSRKGKVFKKGRPVHKPDSLKKYLNLGYKAWANDSYWLVMPFKFFDPGVTLKYIGEANTRAGSPAHVLELTFDSVGVTPQNKYKVYVSKESNLVKQWSYFPHFEDKKPAITTPWLNYQQHGDILLSGNRGQARITGIAVLDSIDRSVFSVYDPLNEDKGRKARIAP